MFPVLQLGPLAIQTPGLILLLGMWLGITLAEKQAPRASVDPHKLSNMVLIAVAVGILGARLTYAAQHLLAFTAAPLNIVALTPTMLDPSGGILVGFLAMLIYGQRKKLSLHNTLDALTPLLLVMQVSIGLANLASGEGYGLPTNMPWGIELWGAYRHPSQVYDLLAATITAGLIWRARSNRDQPGMTFFRFLALSSAARLFLEAYRGDSALLAANIRIVQLVSWSFLALALWQIGKLLPHSKEDIDEPGR